jgi:hypothetical protein
MEIIRGSVSLQFTSEMLPRTINWNYLTICPQRIQGDKTDTK